MLYDEDSYELSLASTAVLLHLLHRLIEDEVVEREAALAILGNAAEALIANPIEMMEVHQKASTLIREEIVPRVWARSDGRYTSEPVISAIPYACRHLAPPRA